MTDRNFNRRSLRRARRFLARRVIYEAEGELRVYELPKDAEPEAALREFAARYNLREDPNDGIWRPERSDDAL